MVNNLKIADKVASRFASLIINTARNIERANGIVSCIKYLQMH